MTRTTPTVADLLAGKGKVQRTNVLCWTVEEASAADSAGVDLINTGMSPAAPRHSSGCPHCVHGRRAGLRAVRDHR